MQILKTELMSTFTATASEGGDRCYSISRKNLSTSVEKIPDDKILTEDKEIDRKTL
jgi:hypothetical protein